VQVTIFAREAARALALAPREQKDAFLRTLARSLADESARVLEANARDVISAKEKSDAFRDRLRLDPARLQAMVGGLLEIADLPDFVGETIAEYTRPNGLRVRRVRVPIGVIAMIYEARPNVTIEAAALCVKSGNAVILRGGADARETNAALLGIVREALAMEKLPEVAVQGWTGSHASIAELVSSDVDLAIPRGGEDLVRFVREHARVPVILHFKGVCHLFLDEGADLESAKKIIFDAKLARPGVCNALECLLVHVNEVDRLLVPIERALEGKCTIRKDEAAYGVEFLDRVLAVRVVRGIDEALAHVARYGSGHTEAILTPNENHAKRWKNEVDAACVVVNASTRFHDGGELGLGAELGIATSRLHWRGPMGLESLTTMKWIVEGEGHVRGT